MSDLVVEAVKIMRVKLWRVKMKTVVFLTMSRVGQSV